MQKYFRSGNFIKRERLPQTFFKNVFTRYCAYLCYALIARLLIFFKIIFQRNKINYRYKVAVCSIFKDEASSLEEWIQYHIVVGIDHFYLYNNNSTDNYLDILQPFIDSGIVDIIDWPYEHSQMSAYEHCYTKSRKDTNWLTFIDIDEFICPLAVDNVWESLLKYKNYPSVAVYWKQFGSNGKLNHDNNKLVIEQYTQCWPLPSIYTKMFCNMDYPIESFVNPHHLNSNIFGISIPPINPFKKFICFGINTTSNWVTPGLQLNHYWGKAYDCFVANKINKTDVYHSNDSEMATARRLLLSSHESMCTDRNYEIQKFLLLTKLKMLS